MSSSFESTVADNRGATVSGPLAMDAPTARASPGPALATGTRLGEFEIVRLIGEGGFGIVYLALDRSLQREVAIKEYLPSSLATREPGSDQVVPRSAQHRETFDAGLRSFVNEARLLARFDHPSLVKVLRFWEGNGTAYMAMPHYRGPTLRHSLLTAAARPSEAELLGWVHPLLDALEVLHQANCCHRDIAPDNILLTERGPVLLDFGAARHVIGDMTQALTVVLKPSFAPIEQYGHSASAGQGPWTDLYALGCVLHFAIVGKAPVTSVERVLFDAFEPLSQAAQGRYSANLLAAIDAALALRPQGRPQDVAAFRRMLQRAEEAADPIDLALPLEEPARKEVTEVIAAPVAATPGRTAPAAAALARTATVAVTPVSAAPLVATPAPAAPAAVTPIPKQPVAATPAPTAPVAATPAPTAPADAAAAVPPPAPAKPPTPHQAAAAAITTAPPAASARWRIVATRGMAATVLVGATLATGWAVHERMQPLPFVLPATATAPPAPEPAAPPPPEAAQPVPVPLPTPLPPASAVASTSNEVRDAASPPPVDAVPTPQAAEPQASDDAPISARPPARAPAQQRAPAARANTGTESTAPAPAPRAATAPAAEAEAGPQGGSRCAEILEKASLGALGPDDAATLKKECR